MNRKKMFSTMYKSIYGQFFVMALALVLLGGCSRQQQWDVVVYGATPAGIIAAVTAADHGNHVVLVEPFPVVGGMYSSGLNTAESEHMINGVITGRARDFFVRLGERYYDSAYFQTFGNGRGLHFTKGDPAFFFESKHAMALFEEMLTEAGVHVIRNAYLIDVRKPDSRVTGIELNTGRFVSGKCFIDCSYEGDLMAAAGVSYTYGREAIDAYDESLAGVRLIDDTLQARTVDDSGRLLPWFNRYDTLVPGSGDKLVMNYNFRPLMTRDKDNFVPVTRPDGYDAGDFDFLAEYLTQHPETELGDLVGKYPRGSGKYEFNNQQKSLVSLGMFGANAGYTEGDWETRMHIYDRHKRWTLGFLYFLGHDPRVPEDLRKEMLSYGFAADEFVNNGHFPHYLYVREGRRMIGQLVQTQHDIYRDRYKEDAVLLGSHWVDSHHVQRVAVSDSSFTNEGRIWEVVLKPFEISWRTLVPREEECTNLLVPVCASFTHVAFCAYRLESTWMQAGHVVGLAAAMAMDTNVPVQQIDIAALMESLEREGMALHADSIVGYDDYNYLENRERYGDWPVRMYEYYGVAVD